MKKLTLLLLIMIMTASGCQQTKSNNTQTGNPFVSLAMTGSGNSATAMNYFKQPRSILELIIPAAFSFPAPTSMIDSNNNLVLLNQNWISVGEIEFKANEMADSEEVDGSDVEFSGPFSIDLFSNTPQPLGFSNVTVGQIKRIKMKLSKNSSLPTGAPAGFLGKSIFIAGSVNGHSFTYSTTEETELEISGPSAVTPLESKTLLVEIKTATLIKKINLSSITSTTTIDESHRIPTTNPCPAIDSSATDLFTCLRKGFETESNLGRDDNGDYKLDGSEDSVK